MFASENITRRIAFLNPLGRFIWYVNYYTKSMKVYEDGDEFFGFIFNWWHPVTWITFICLLVPCAFMNISIQSLFPIKMDEYWAKRQTDGKLIWL